MAQQSSKKARSAGKDKGGIRPLGDRVLVLPVSEEAKTASGIIIPDTIDKEKPEQGKVVAVGPGKFVDGSRKPIDVSVGDMVVFSKYGYDEVKVGGVEYYLIKEDNILAVITS